LNIKLIKIIILFLFLILLFNPNIPCQNINSIKTIYVDIDNIDGPWDGSIEHPFKNITEGVKILEGGDSIFVFGGNYTENIKINISDVNIIGENNENTNLIGHIVIAFEIYGDNVTLSGFNISNSGDYGIYISANYSNIKENNFYKNNDAIYFSHYIENHHIIIDNNNFINNEKSLSGFFIDNSIINNNIFTSNKNGIYLIDNNNLNICNNSFQFNDNPLIIIEGKNCLIENNIITYNKNIGVGLYSGNSNNIQKNIISYNQTYGIAFLKEENSNIYNNIIENNNEAGIFFDGENMYNTIENNNITNFNCIILKNNSNSNYISNNNIISKGGAEAYFVDSIHNKWIRNYWGESNTFLKIIFGEIHFFNSKILWLNVDINPTKKPFNI